MSNEVKGEGHWSRGLRLKVQKSAATLLNLHIYLRKNVDVCNRDASKG